jgi:hypothetical protein
VDAPRLHRPGVRSARPGDAVLVISGRQSSAIVADMVAWKVTLKIYAGSGRSVGRKIIEEGHKHGLIVTGHLSNYTAQEAVEDGIDCLEHITSVFDFIIPLNVRREAGHRASLDIGNPQAKALIATLAKRKIMVDPTLTVFKNMLLLSDLEEVNRHPDNGHMPERLRSYWDTYRLGQGLAQATCARRRKEFQKYQELTGVLFGAGVPLLAGTHARHTVRRSRSQRDQDKVLWEP